jgi:hypothetical protein
VDEEIILKCTSKESPLLIGNTMPDIKIQESILNPS